MNKLDLTNEEALLLDGKVGADAQAVVDRVKAAMEIATASPDLSATEAAFVAKVLERAILDGGLTYTYTNLTYCAICTKHGGFPVYKTGYRKGQRKDRGRQLTFPGCDLARAFITFQGHATLGGCRECIEKIKPVLIERLAGVRAQLPEALAKKGSQRFVRFDNRKCECGWEGHEGQMIQLPALMGGTYPGECPKCHAKNLVFGRSFITHRPGVTVEESPHA